MREHRLVESAGPPGERPGAWLIECIPVGQSRVESGIVDQSEQPQITHQALTHFMGRQPCEGHCQHLIRLGAFKEGPHDPTDQQRGLAAAGAGVDDDAVGRIDRRSPESMLIDLTACDAKVPAIAWPAIARRNAGCHDQCPLRQIPRTGQ